MKSQEHVILQVVAGLLADAQLAYPSTRGFDKDLVRVTSCVKNRGLGFLTLDLPNLDTILLDGLETGRLVLFGPCSHARSKRIKVPRLFSGLWLRVFHESGILKDEPDVTAIAFLRQLSCVAKKVEVPCAPFRILDAMEGYHDVERQARTPTLRWELDFLDPDDRIRTVHFHDGMDVDLPLFPEHSALGKGEIRRLIGNLTRICDKVSTAIGLLDPYEFSEREGSRGSGTVNGLRHGPGAVSDQSRKCSKYIFKSWPEKLQNEFPFDAYGVLNPLHIDENNYPVNHEAASKICCVPKTAKTPRLIASEPLCHQWTQQLVASMLIEKLTDIFGRDFITIRDQEPSRNMVVTASLDGEVCTLDLSSASDRLTCWVVERVFRRNPPLLRLLHATRTRWTFDGISTEPSWRKLRKFSTQGSALTFPIQSIVFLCCALAVLPRMRGLKDYRRKYRKVVRVFGDDIIIPKTGYDSMITLLHYLGLKVNMEKSFSTGLFRESCGMDCYKGYNVTPVKPKVFIATNPTSTVAVIDSSNNLFKKGYWRAAAALESTLSRRVLSNLPVTGPDVGTLGRTSFCGSDISHLRKRVSSTLHRPEVLVYQAIDRSKRKSTGGYEGIFQFLTEKPRPDSVWFHGIPSEPKVRDRLRWVDAGQIL